jgi:hypothetical protein
MKLLQWYQWMALAALGICILALVLHFLRLLRLGKPQDYSIPAGKTGKAIAYAFTGAMSPARKESAYLHLPTYSAGILYHTGTFLSMFLFFFFISGIFPQGLFAKIIIAFLAISAGCGAAILVKRIVRKELRILSNPDDFISNILVTLFQFSTILVLLTLLFPTSPLPPFPASPPPGFLASLLPSYSPIVLQSYYLLYTLLMLYIPVGKLRHTIYFFAARYQLGVFYGWRGVWPLRKLKKL